MTKTCPFRGQSCQHPDWADCQFKYHGDEDVIWKAREVEMGRNCSWLPEGIFRWEMLAALGANGEEEQAWMLKNVKEGYYGMKKRRMFGRE